VLIVRLLQVKSPFALNGPLTTTLLDAVGTTPPTQVEGAFHSPPVVVDVTDWANSPVEKRNTATKRIIVQIDFEMKLVVFIIKRLVDII
jgi:hypothetical protein